jgi:hypothetical protein
MIKIITVISAKTAPTDNPRTHTNSGKKKWNNHRLRLHTRSPAHHRHHAEAAARQKSAARQTPPPHSRPPPAATQHPPPVNADRPGLETRQTVPVDANRPDSESVCGCAPAAAWPTLPPEQGCLMASARRPSQRRRWSDRCLIKPVARSQRRLPVPSVVIALPPLRRPPCFRSPWCAARHQEAQGPGRRRTACRLDSKSSAPVPSWTTVVTELLPKI